MLPCHSLLLELVIRLERWQFHVIAGSAMGEYLGERGFETGVRRVGSLLAVV